MRSRELLAVGAGDRHAINVQLGRVISGGCTPALAHMGTLMPRLTSQTFAGQEAKYPMIMPTCMRSQKAAELGMSWCGAGNSTNAMTAIQPNRPTSNAVSEMKSALAAAI